MLTVAQIAEVARACEVKPSLAIDHLLRSLEDPAGVNPKHAA